MNVKVNITTDSGSDVDQVSRAVATRLKAYRKAKKMSLDELSRRASISKGMLVEMEKEAANPSIAILCKLAAALGVSVADIVNVSSEPALHIIPAEQIPTLWQGPLGGSARLLAGTAGPNVALGDAARRSLCLAWPPGNNLRAAARGSRRADADAWRDLPHGGGRGIGGGPHRNRARLPQ